MHNTENITWCQPRWKLLWTLSVLLIVCGLLLLSMIPRLDQWQQQAIASQPGNETMIKSLVENIYPLMLYLASVCFWAAYTYFRFTRFAIGMTGQNQLCIRRASGQQYCEDARQLTWSDNTLLIGGQVIHGLHTRRIQALTAYHPLFIEEQLKPCLLQENKISPFAMYRKLIRRLDAQSLFMTYLAVSITFFMLWYKL